LDSVDHTLAVTGAHMRQHVPYDAAAEGREDDQLQEGDYCFPLHAVLKIGAEARSGLAMYKSRAGYPPGPALPATRSVSLQGIVFFREDHGGLKGLGRFEIHRGER